MPPGLHGRRGEAADSSGSGLRLTAFPVAGAIASIALLVALFAVAALHMDISAARDFQNDAIVRDAAPSRFAGLDVRRYLDPSPFSIWLPSDWHVWESIRSGTLPFWDRMQGGGYSPVVALQNGVFHPVRWIAAAFPRRAAPSALIAIALFAAFMGMLVLGREYGLSTAASVVAAGLFSFGPMAMSFVEFSGALLPIAHLPWLVAAYRSAARNRNRSVIFVGIVSALTLLSGHPLMIFVVGSAFGALVIAEAIASRAWRPLVPAVIGGLGGTALVAFALLPPLLAASQSWSYKTHSVVGVPYSAYSLPQFSNAVLVFMFDLHRPKTCCFDAPPFFLFTGIPAIVLATVGSIALWRTSVRRSLPVLLIASAALAIPGPWMAPFAGLRPLSFLKPWYVWPSFVFFLAVAVGAGFDSCVRSGRPLWRVVAALLVVALIPMYGRRIMEVLAPRTWRAIDQSAALDFLRSQRGPSRITALWGQTHMPNASRTTGVEDVRISAPVIPLRYALWWQAVDPDVLSRAYPTVRITERLDSALVGDFNIAYVVQGRLPFAGTFTTIHDPSRRDTMLSPNIRDDHFPLVFRAPSVEIRRNAGPVRPRAHFADRVLCVSSMEKAFAMLSADRQLAATTAVVECERSLSLPPVATGDVSLTFPDERHVRMLVRSGSGGLVVLHDTFAPGWKATVDGYSAPVLPVNILSRGVVVPPGEHSIEMTYVPPGLFFGLCISAVTLVVGGVLMKAGSSRRAAENRS